ncbi:hypothetical protein HAP48_0032970 [Bradyrhizobium septentrionale]|uniref:Uncharacterized protein n=1 Tax=Bradyrhizobium septentrionale TaxID=1404411 RepID=A0A973VZY4_9BRAD|nr:hypothetical protein [Bradyrhizobium septentrionale]UGY13376.1 hypothetical protein HAP48_0032970 [Bradyrhizobium septentrionale]
MLFAESITIERTTRGSKFHVRRRLAFGGDLFVAHSFCNRLTKSISVIRAPAFPTISMKNDEQTDGTVLACLFVGCSSDKSANQQSHKISSIRAGGTSPFLITPEFSDEPGDQPVANSTLEHAAAG